MTRGSLQTVIDFKELVEALGDAIIVADSDGVIRFWNPAAERLFGFTRDEALGKSLDLIIPERLRARHWAGYAKTMSTGETQYTDEVLRVPAVHKDGRTISIAFTVGMLQEQQKLTSIVAVVRDETAHFTEDQKLRKRLAELTEKTAHSDLQGDTDRAS